jgi:hypothetical protein
MSVNLSRNHFHLRSMSALDDHLKSLVSEHGGEVNGQPDDLTLLEQWQRSSDYLPELEDVD